MSYYIAENRKVNRDPYPSSRKCLLSPIWRGSSTTKPQTFSLRKTHGLSNCKQAWTPYFGLLKQTALEPRNAPQRHSLSKRKLSYGLRESSELKPHVCHLLLQWQEFLAERRRGAQEPAVASATENREWLHLHGERIQEQGRWACTAPPRKQNRGNHSSTTSWMVLPLQAIGLVH